MQYNNVKNQDPTCISGIKTNKTASQLIKKHTVNYDIYRKELGVEISTASWHPRWKEEFGKSRKIRNQCYVFCHDVEYREDRVYQG